MSQRIYFGEIDPDTLADHLVEVFNQNNYAAHPQTMAQRVGRGEQVLVQIMHAGSWGRNGGALNVNLTRIPAGITINFGQANWLDRDEATLAGMVVGALFFPPLLLLPLLAGLMDSTFDQDVWNVIEGYCAWHAQKTGPTNPPRFFYCRHCGAHNRVDAVKCERCNGPLNASSSETQSTPPSPEAQAPVSDLSPADRTSPLEAAGPDAVVCSACGASVAYTKFCGNCATPLAARE